MDQGADAAFMARSMVFDTSFYAGYSVRQGFSITVVPDSGSRSVNRTITGGTRDGKRLPESARRPEGNDVRRDGVRVNLSLLGTNFMY
ncbi:MAG: hypothetical protein EHM62_03890 [Methylococcus sp.]|nr:MAG: hypothetical protein EHM62_03890 [Methylococcus sp.]